MSLIREKVDQAKAILQELDLDCWITFVRESQINGDPILPFLVAADLTWHSAFIVSASGATHAIVGLYDQKTVEETGAWDEVEGFVEGLRKPFQAVMKKLAPRKIALNYSVGSEICDGLTHGMYLTMHEMLSEIDLADRIVSAERLVSALRERKSAAELDAMRRAIRATEQIFAEVGAFIRPGVTEQEIAAFMKDKAKQRGVGLAWEPAVCPAVFTGPETAGAHYAPTDRKVARGHVLNMDFGVRVDGYCSDMQRTFYVLDKGEKEAPAEVRRGFEVLTGAIEAARRAMKPGAQGREVDAAARNAVVGAGYKEFPHALGHQVGRFSHDGTALLGPMWEKYAQKPLQKLEENMVFTIEPRLPVEGRGTVTIEEMAVVTATGAEYLSAPQRELLLIR